MLKRAVEIAGRIESLEAELHQILGGGAAPAAPKAKAPPAPAPAPSTAGQPSPKGRVISPESRRKMAEAQKRRWAKNAARKTAPAAKSAPAPAAPVAARAAKAAAKAPKGPKAPKVAKTPKRGGKRTFSPEARAKMAAAARRRWAAVKA